MPFNKLDAEQLRFVTRQGRPLGGDTIARIVEGEYAADLRKDLFQDFESLARQVPNQIVNAGESASRFCETVYETAGDRVTADAKHNRRPDLRSYCLHDDQRRKRVNEIDLFLLKN